MLQEIHHYKIRHAVRYQEKGNGANFFIVLGIIYIVFALFYTGASDTRVLQLEQQARQETNQNAQ